MALLKVVETQRPFGAMKRDWSTAKGPITIESYPTVETIEALDVDDGIGLFAHYTPGSAARQKEIMLRTAAARGGNTIVAYTPAGTIIGYMCIVPPDDEERWGGQAFPFVVEFGLVEVSRNWRGIGLAAKMMDVACSDPALEDQVAVTTSYAWHWDLRDSGLSKWEYRGVLKRLLDSHGFELLATDEENILFDPANMLMVRFGSRVAREQVAKFERTLFRQAVVRDVA